MIAKEVPWFKQVTLFNRELTVVKRSLKQAARQGHPPSVNIPSMGTDIKKDPPGKSRGEKLTFFSSGAGPKIVR